MVGLDQPGETARQGFIITLQYMGRVHLGSNLLPTVEYGGGFSAADKNTREAGHLRRPLHRPRQTDIYVSLTITIIIRNNHTFGRISAQFMALYWERYRIGHVACSGLVTFDRL